MAPHVDISIIVPCFNTARYVDQALCSIEQNGAIDLEVIAINDGSTDDSLSIMLSHAARDHRVRVIDKPNEGYGATVNRGLKEARGTYVAIVEPDDWVLPSAYDRLCSIARLHGNPDVVKTPYWRIMTDSAGKELRARGYLYGRVRTMKHPMLLRDEPELIQYHPAIWSAIYRRDFLVQEDIRMLEVPGAGWVDNPFCVHTLAAAQSIVYEDEPFYCYREDLASASSANVAWELMVDRWNDRQDVLDRLGVKDKGILRANYVVGLRYLCNVFDRKEELESSGAIHRLQNMAGRMDPTIVATITCIPPHVVAWCLELAGSTLKAPSGLRYKEHLVREAWWAFRFNGVGFLAHNLKLSKANKDKA